MHVDPGGFIVEEWNALAYARRDGLAWGQKRRHLRRSCRSEHIPDELLLEVGRGRELWSRLLERRDASVEKRHGAQTSTAGCLQAFSGPRSQPCVDVHTALPSLGTYLSVLGEHRLDVPFQLRSSALDLIAALALAAPSGAYAAGGTVNAWFEPASGVLTISADDADNTILVGRGGTAPRGPLAPGELVEPAVVG
jgi:hypothetical protein